MKKLVPLLFLVPLAMAGCYSTGQMPARSYDDYATNSTYNNDYNANYNNTEVSYQVFYDQLQPYGNWINYPGHGYVWQPRAEQGFRPYETNGQWVSTVDGWAWASNYSWGWAPFHYGRWLNEPAIGWVWVPGYEWAPAWVTWGSYNNYYAWAPLAPGINVRFGSTWRAPLNYWSCVPRNRMHQSNFSNYIVRPDRNNVENNITIINNYNTYNNNQYYNKGPEYQEVERFSNSKITPVAIASINSPGATKIEGKQLQVYRPPVKSIITKNEAPSRVSSLDEAKSRLSSIRQNRQINEPVQPGTTQPETGISDARANIKGGSINRPTEGTAGEVYSSGNRSRIIAPGTNNNTGSNTSEIKTAPLTTQPNTNNNPVQRVETQITQPQQQALPNQPRREIQQPENNRKINTNRSILENNRSLPNNGSRTDRNQPVFQNNRSVPPASNAPASNNNRVAPQQGAAERRMQTLPRATNRSVQPAQNNNAARPAIVRPPRQ